MKMELVFEEINESAEFADYTADCSGSRSDCCTRTCSSDGDCDMHMSADAWGRFLEINGGVIQY